jgi:hypothetical protein
MRSIQTLNDIMINSTSSKNNNDKYGKCISIYKRVRSEYTCISIVYLLVLLYLAIIIFYSLMVKILNFDNFSIF